MRRSRIELSGRPVPVWPYHPFFTNSDLPTAEADLTRRPCDRGDHVRAADRRTRSPTSRPGTSRPTAPECCAAIAHDLLPAADTLAGAGHAVARGATFLATWATSLPRPARRPFLRLPASPPPTNRRTGPRQGLTMWTSSH